MMRKERFVFGRQKCADQRLRKIDIPQLHAPFTRIGRHDFAIGAAHHCRQGRLIGQQFVGAGQRADDKHPQRAIHQHQDQQDNRQAPRPAPHGDRAPDAHRPARGIATDTPCDRAGGVRVLRYRVFGRCVGGHRQGALKQDTIKREPVFCISPRRGKTYRPAVALVPAAWSARSISMAWATARPNSSRHGRDRMFSTSSGLLT